MYFTKAPHGVKTVKSALCEILKKILPANTRSVNYFIILTYIHAYIHYIDR